MKKALALFLVFAMLCASFAACGNQAKDVLPAAHGWVNTYWDHSPLTLNPYAAADAVSSEALSDCTTALYRLFVSEDGKTVTYLPELAADYPESTDEEGKVWQVTLRDDCKWANGTVITAEDIVYSLQMQLDPVQLNPSASEIVSSSQFSLKNAGKYISGECEWDDVGVKLTGENTVEFTSETPVSSERAVRFFSLIRPVYKPLFEAGLSSDGTVTDYGTTYDKFMSAGRFILTEWTPDTKLIFTRNPDYVYADKIKIEGVIYSIISDSSTAAELFAKGELDYVSLDRLLWDEYGSDERVREYLNDCNMYMFLNFGNPAQNNLLSNYNFRNALNHGLDREGLAEAISAYPSVRYAGRSVSGDPATGRFFVGIQGSEDYLPDVSSVFDPALANECLMKAFEERNLGNASLELIHSESSASDKARDEWLQNSLGSVFGEKLVIKLRAVPPGQTAVLCRKNPQNPASFEAAIDSLHSDKEAPNDSFRFFSGNALPPRFCWQNDEFDELYERSRSQEAYLDNELMLSLCRQMEKIVLDELVVIPVYETPEKVMFSSRIKLPLDGYNTQIGFGFPAFAEISD